MSVQALTHAQKVTRLYRNLLKNMLSWTIYRRVWREEALELRAQFDANKHVDMGTAIRLLKEGEEMYERHKHPDPYVSSEAPGGSKWERNLPPPPHILELAPEEKEWFDEWAKKAPIK